MWGRAPSGRDEVLGRGERLTPDPAHVGDRMKGRAVVGTRVIGRWGIHWALEEREPGAAKPT